MKFNKFGVVCASLAISMVGIASSSSSAQATLVNRTAEYFGEDLQSFGKDPRITQEEFGEVKLNNIYAAEQNFLNALTGSYTTLGFEANEGFQAQDNSKDTKRNLNYDLNLEMNDGTFLDMTIFDQNTGKNKHRTSIQKTSESLKESSIFNYQGGRYGIADANASLEDKMNNQFLNTNAGKNSSLEFSFENQLMSAFSFFATDFDRGGNIALEFTRQDGSTYDVNLQPGDLTADNDRGTANFYGFIADEGDYFTDVRFKLADGITGNKDMVGLDRMTFAAAPIKEVPEPSVGLLALGAVVSGAAFKKRKKK
jgi:hypothetical protein